MKDENQDVLDYVITEGEEPLNVADEETEVPNSEDIETEGTETETPNDKATKEYEVPDILGNNKLGYNIWDTIVKGV